MTGSRAGHRPADGSPARSGYHADVAIAGFGLMGSLVAHWLTAAGLRVIVVDKGTPMSTRAGTHLRNLAWCRADPAFYHSLVRSQLRPVSVAPPSGIQLGDLLARMPQSAEVNVGQRAELNLPAAPQTRIFGGMGTLWNCVAPRLRLDLEHWSLIAPTEWDRLYHLAEEALRVSPYPAGYSRRQDFLLDALAGLSARPAPIAGRLRPGCAPVWTGPAEIRAEATRSRLELLPEHLITRLLHRSGRVTAAEVVALESGQRFTVTADTFVIAAGSLRTPALLWASGIGSDTGEGSALGRYLCDHPLCYARVIIDGARSGDLLADPDPYVIIPITSERPFHAVLTCDAYGDQMLEGRIDERLIISMYWYTLTEPRRDNRVRCEPGAPGRLGLPRLTFEYALDDADRAGQQVALADMREAGQRLGPFAPAGTPHVLSPGSSMHIMGTTRMGAVSDGESVTNSYGQVWGFDNLYLAGLGLIPCATATNPTLAACAMAIRTAERISCS